MTTEPNTPEQERDLLMDDIMEEQLAAIMRAMVDELLR